MPQKKSIKMNKIFLGGTCGDSTWREELKPLLRVPYFDPVVKNWTKECIARENKEKSESTIRLYVIACREC